jgi:hypothetical protein
MNILDKLIINFKENKITLNVELSNVIKITCNDIFKKLNVLDKERLIFLVEYLIYIINNKFNITNNSQWYLKNNRDIKGIFLLLLPYIDYNLLENLSSINEIVFTKKMGISKHEDENKNVNTILNPDYFKKSRDEMKYLTQYSNIGLGFIKNIKEIYILTDDEDTLPYKIIENKFTVLLDTINIINGKLYVNWINIFPISLEDYKNSEIYKNTNLDFQSTNNYNYKGLYFGDFYNILRNKCYDNMKKLKWLLFCDEKTQTYLIQKLNNIINLNDILNNEFVNYNDLPDNEKNIFKNSIHKINDIKILKEILNFFINNEKKKLDDKKFIIFKNFFIKTEDDLYKEENQEDGSFIRKNSDEDIKLCFDIIKENYIDIFWNYLKNKLDNFKNTIFGRILIEKINDKYIINNLYYYKDTKLNLKNIYNIAKTLSHDDNWTVLDFFYIQLDRNNKINFFYKINGLLDFNLRLRNNLNIQFDGIPYDYNQKIIELKSDFRKIIKDFIFEELIKTGVLSEFKNREPFDILSQYLNKLFENKKWGDCYYYLTNDKYKNLKIEKISYFKSLEKQYWMSFFAMDWISQIGFFNHFIINQVIYSTGATGQGKSTQVPKLLLYSLKAINYKDNGKIICSQPRIAPTTENAMRIALELGVPIENENKERLNNYSVQFKYQTDKHKINNNSMLSLLICTDGVLYNIVKNNMDMFEKNDNDKKNPIYDIIIVDEAHEHNPNMDLILTLGRFSCFNNKKIKLVIVSATMDDDEPIYRTYYKLINDNNHFPIKYNYKQNNLNINLNYIDRRYHISPPGESTQYKITEIYLDKNLTSEEAKIEGQKTIINICKNTTSGDILFFCNGEDDILDAVKFLNMNTPSDTIALPYFSKLNQQYKDIINKINIFKYKLKIKKQDVFTVWKETYFEDSSVQNNIYKRVIIIATNVAEASITLEDLKYVVDNGYTKTNILDNIFGKSKLVIEEIAESSRVQRKGRVGRVSDGTVYYMYKKDGRKNNKTKYKITQQDMTDIINSLLVYKDISEINSQNNNEYTMMSEIYKNGFISGILDDRVGIFYIIHPLENIIQRNIINNIIQEKISNKIIDTNNINLINISRFKKNLYNFNLLIDYNNQSYISKNEIEIISRDEYKTEFGNILSKFKSIENINNKILLLHAYGLNIEVEISELLLFINIIGNNINKLFIQNYPITNSESDILILYDIIKKIKNIFSNQNNDYYIQKYINEFNTNSKRPKDFDITIWNNLQSLKRNGKLNEKYKSTIQDNNKYKSIIQDNNKNIEEWCIKNNLNYQMINDFITKMNYIKYDQKIKNDMQNLNLNYNKLLFKNTIEEKILFCFVLSNYQNLCINYENNKYIFNKQIINKNSASKTLTNISNNFVFVYQLNMNDDDTVTFNFINKINLTWIIYANCLFYNPKYFSYYDLILDETIFNKLKHTTNYKYLQNFIASNFNKNLILWNNDKTPLMKRYYNNINLD